MTRLEQMIEFLEQDPGDSFTRYAVALEYVSARDFGAALEQFMELRKRDPDYVALYYQLGGLYVAEENWGAAREAYEAGSAIARKLRDLHTLSELEAALDELETLQ